MEPEKDLYRIQYVDNTFQLVNWTDEEFVHMFGCMDNEKEFPIALINKCIYRIRDIRTIVHLPKEELSDTEKSTHIVETEEGSYDKELYNLLLDTGMISPEEKGGKA